MKHFLKKLKSTAIMLFCLGCARTFGEYQHSIGGAFDYAIYTWRGKRWAFPTGPIEEWVFPDMPGGKNEQKRS